MRDFSPTHCTFDKFWEVIHDLKAKPFNPLLLCSRMNQSWTWNFLLVRPPSGKKILGTLLHFIKCIQWQYLSLQVHLSLTRNCIYTNQTKSPKCLHLYLYMCIVYPHWHLTKIRSQSLVNWSYYYLFLYDNS